MGVGEFMNNSGKGNRIDIKGALGAGGDGNRRSWGAEVEGETPGRYDWN